MAKKTQKESYSHTVINKEDMTITEYTKDECKVYSLNDLLDRWDGVEDVSLIISQNVEIEESETE